MIFIAWKEVVILGNAFDTYILISYRRRNRRMQENFLRKNFVLESERIPFDTYFPFSDFNVVLVIILDSTSCLYPGSKWSINSISWVALWNNTTDSFNSRTLWQWSIYNVSHSWPLFPTLETTSFWEWLSSCPQV